jgi:DNA-binding transcriptional LysR family regulator
MQQMFESRVVLSVLELGSFTAAGARHGITGSAAAKLVSRVEGGLDVKLLARSTRRLTVTPEGEMYFSRMRRVLADLDELAEEISSNRSSPRGPLKVTCPNFFFVRQLAFKLPGFLARFPRIQLELQVTDRRVDMVGEAFDVGVRLGTLGDSAMSARKVCDLYRGVYAAPKYLELHGIPRCPDELRAHECLYSNHGAELDLWPFKDGAGVRMVKVRNRLALNDAEAVFHAGLAGLGIVHISDVLATEPVAQGKLVPLLQEHYQSSPVPLSLLMLPGRQRTARVARFIEFFVEEFGGAPWRHPQAHSDQRAVRASQAC